MIEAIRQGAGIRPKRLGIMQPYFLPYIGYFALIAHCDCFILFDTAQYERHGWMNRNRILKPGGGWQYITVPLAKHPRESAVSRVFPACQTDWRDRVRRQLEHYRRRAPYFPETMEVVERGWRDGENLSSLNRNLLESILRYLGIHRSLECLSELDLSLPPVDSPGDWALNIAQQLNAASYVNPPGGKRLFERKRFEASGIELRFLEHKLPEYSQRNRFPFEPALSIVDVLMFNDPPAVRAMLTDYLIA